MTWTLNLVGHVETKEKEGEILSKIRDLISRLYEMDADISSGNFSGMFGVQESFAPLTVRKKGE